ncbi:cytochrome c oxidase subunit IVB [Pseudogracilibacillus auburnensis]|uniref:Cytochrome c oxidase subunit 4 n=1 Tax=Pseudogracilibacillus auburnensis TaxID=1494959 RepID=A0A2V3W8C6_9BACI|nr:cytochrome c oxidase subunit IVB [Pseudogracilibacillus auburnensis]MBO1003542.1 cytochrome c oxidase subunit IVB [Pseudogracilibacillus auburnensis]PXW89231.1 cytochrome c oxidase subunit 4 [Pseudogracilibacillus auburnensis]
MTDNSNDQTEVFKRQKSKEEMQRQLISFGLMIVFTLIAFAIVATDTVDRIYILPILFIMAIVQAGFQFYYFMHLKDKGHEMPALLIYGGVWAAFLTLAGLMVISWW